LRSPSGASSFALLPWWWLQDRGIHFDVIRWIALGVGLVAAAAFLRVPRRWVVVFPALVAVYFGLTTAVVLDGRHGIRHTSVGSLWAGIRVTPTNWIDRLVKPNATVVVLWPPNPEPRPVWNNEFFNRTVGTIYSLGADPYMGGLPETVVHIRADGVVASGDKPLPPVQYALVPTDVAGQKIGADPRIGLSLFHVNGPLVVLTRISGVDPDAWGTRSVVYRRFECAGGHVTVSLASDGHLFETDQTIVVRQAGAVVRTIVLPPTATPAAPLSVTVPLQPKRGTCTLSFTAAATRVPAFVEPGSNDHRRLAAHYLSFIYTP
jgi:hypothetical protein